MPSGDNSGERTEVIVPSTADATVATPPATPAAAPVDPEATKAVDPGVTRAVDPEATKAVDSEATSVLPATDAAATSVLRPHAPDATAVAPPAAPSAPPDAGRWKGQAGVRPVTSEREATGQWAVPEPTRAWWLPIVLGIVGLLILVGVAFALVVAMKGGSSPSPATSATTPASTPSPSVTATPSTPPPTPSDTGTAGLVAIPTSLNGLFLTDAEALLSQSGLNYTEMPQVTTTALPNTVIGTTPEAGTSVPAGSTVVLIYAQAPAPSDSSSVPPPGPSTPATSSS